MNGGASTTDSIYARLEAAILSGQLKPRERLVERNLEKEFGVSRTPVREALQQLRYAGLVKTAAGRGVIVRDVDVAEAFNLYMVRLPLEKLAIEITPPLAAEDHERLRGLLDELSRAFAGNNFPYMVALNTRFHHALTALTCNDWLLSVLEQLRRQCYLVVQHGPVAERRGLSRALAEHAQMVDLLAARELGALTALTFQHILHSAIFYLRRSIMLDSSAEQREATLKSAAEQLLRAPPLTLSLPDQRPFWAGKSAWRGNDTKRFARPNPAEFLKT